MSNHDHPSRPPLIDPRAGDVEDDASSPESRSMLAIAGSLLVEISLPKLVLSWGLMIVLPGLALGAAPLVASAWLKTVSGQAGALVGFGPVLLLGLILLVGWIGGRPVFRLIEKSFWSLTSLAVQPGYAVFREGLRHFAEPLLRRGDDPEHRARVNAAIAAVAGLLSCVVALAVFAWAWPGTRWSASLGDLGSPLLLLRPALANAVAIVALMMAGASLVWGLADATMDQARDIEAFDAAAPEATGMRVVHLSDIHVVGERHGLRIESGRSGPSGNGRLALVFDRLAAIHAENPVDLIVITGDMTDAGRSAEWVECELALSRHPALRERMLMLPGNHDVNIIDRANPARLALPGSPLKRLRQLRTLSAMDALQGDRVRVLAPDRERLGPTLAEAIAPHREAIATFADHGSVPLSARLAQLWADVFPMVLPPPTPDGLGVILLNSNAETHFSFTNALGMVSLEQANGLTAVAAAFPQARWIVALHHHLVEYPKPATAFSERIGTALINGSWFVRQLKPLGGRVVAMHGHRHVNWIGRCGALRIISAPSPVMGGRDDVPTHFHIHTLSRRADRGLALLQPETVVIAPEGRAS
jgi:hypothetical protein